MTTQIDSDTREFYRGVGLRMRERRTVLGLTTREVSTDLGVANRTYRLWEAGNFRMPLDFLPDLCRVLGLTPQQLLGMD